MEGAWLWMCSDNHCHGHDMCVYLFPGGKGTTVIINGQDNEVGWSSQTYNTADRLQRHSGHYFLSV